MTLLLGFLAFLVLAFLGGVDAAYGEESRPARCPTCGLEALSRRADDAYACTRCGARYRRRYDGALVRA